MPKPEDLPSGSQIGIWYYGATGTGKSHRAREEYPDAYMKPAVNKWWDGYQQQDAVIIDDLDKKHDYMGYYLKIWADRYAFIAESKGGALYIRPKTLVVTSNYKPEDIWDDETTLGPIKRRFKVTKFVTFADEVRRMVNNDEDEVPAYVPTPGYAPGFRPHKPATAHSLDTDGVISPVQPYLGLCHDK